MQNEQTVDAQLAGIQVAIFELIWPTFKWIRSIRLAEVDKLSCLFCVQTDAQPGLEEIEACRAMMGEILEAAFGETGLTWQLVFGVAPGEKNTVVKEIMSANIFKMIAAEVAPWRLGTGR